MIKHTKKSGKTLISCLMGKIPYFRVFPLFLVCLVIKKSQLLKKPSMKFFLIQDLSSTHGEPKLLFYDYSWQIFFLQPIAEGNCDLN